MIGNNLKNIRKEKQLTQKEFAEKMNVKQCTISLWENEERELTTSIIIKLCEILEVTPNELFGIYEWQLEEKKEKNKTGDTFNINNMRDINIKK